MIKLCVITYADLMQKKRLSESKFYFLQSFIKTKYCNTFFWIGFTPDKAVQPLQGMEF